MALDVELVPFIDMPAEVLAKGLAEAAASNLERIAESFPAVPRRYGSIESAIKSVREVQHFSANNQWDLRSYAVVARRVVIGALNLQPQSGPIGPWEAVLPVDGPQVDVWLGSRAMRPDQSGCLLQDVLQLAAVMIQNEGMDGQAWAVVRPGFAYIVGCLEKMGFVRRGEPQNYNELDGVCIPRQLYVYVARF